MQKLTESELKKLYKFDTMGLLDGVDQVDKIKENLSSQLPVYPLKVRESLLSLHRHLSRVTNEGAMQMDVGEVFELTYDVECELDEIIDHAEKIKSVISDLYTLLPTCVEL